MSEELALQEAGGDGRAVDGGERLVRARAPLVDGPREPLLAGAGLAQDQHRRVGLRHLPRPPRQIAHGRVLARLQDSLGLSPELALEHLRVRVLLAVQPLEGRAVLGVLDGDGEDLAVDLDQVHDRGGIGLTHAAVEGQDAEGALARAEGNHHAGMAVGEIEDPVEGIAVAVSVVVFGIGTRPAGLERLLDRGEVGKSQLVMANGVARERASSRARHELRPFEDEEGGEVVGCDPAQPIEATAEEIFDAVVLGRHLGELTDVPCQVDLGGILHVRQPTTIHRHISGPHS